jgi:putative peptidoglycan lipid II flippase
MTTPLPAAANTSPPHHPAAQEPVALVSEDEALLDAIDPSVLAHSDDNSPSTATPPPPSKERSMLKAVSFMAVLILFSKVLGFARDWIIFDKYGASLATDAYFSAQQLPFASIVLLGGLGGPFHTASIAILSRHLTKNAKGEDVPTDKARELAATFTTATSIVFFLISVVVYFKADWVMRALLGGGGGNPALVAAASAQLQIMAPVIWIGSLVGIFYGALNMLHVYLWPAISPTVLSIAIVVALMIFPADSGGMLLAWSTLVGAGLQFIIQVPEYLQKGFTLRPSLTQLKTPEMRHLGELLFPALLGTTIGQATTFVDMAFASHLPEGGWSAISLSNRLMQLPIGVLQTALLVPLFPRLTKLASEGNDEALGKSVQQGVAALWWVVMPVMAFLFFYAKPVIAFTFEHGGFDAADTQMVSWAVMFQLASMVPYFFRDTITRVFYAYGDSLTPLVVGISAMALKGALNWLFVFGLPGFSVGGITLSITLVTFFNALLLGFLVRRHTRSIPYVGLFKVLAKLSCAVVPAVVVFAAAKPLLSFSHLPIWLNLVLVFGVGFGVYSLASWVLRVEEVRVVGDRLRQKFGKAT